MTPSADRDAAVRRAPRVVAQVGPARVWCSERADGNVGDRVGDQPEVVAANRDALASALGLPSPRAWVWLRQVHGTAVHVADGATDPAEAPVADAAVTTVPGLPLAVVTADCVPLVLAGDDAVAVVHAGHRGLAAGVIEATLGQLRSLGSGAVRAFLAPCIRAPRYEFGASDLAALVEQFGPTVEARTTDGRPAFDIPAAIRVVLAREGVADVEDCGLCTAESPRWFSYRRDGVTGRQATIARLA